jgi:gliding motility-associated-like protein
LNTQPVQFTDLSTSATSWSWNFGDPSSASNTSVLQNPKHAYTVAGNFSVTLTVTNRLGCTNTTTVPVIIPVPVTATATASIDSIKSGASTTLMATGGGTYLWSPTIGLSCDTCHNATAGPKQTTKYCVIVTDKNSCSDTACVDVYVSLTLLIPNVFSPNGDGVNDVFTITANGYKNLQVVIFDRWGIKVGEWTGIAGSWNGQTTSGKDAPDGVYYFIATLTKNEGTIEKVPGNVYLLRSR